METFLLILKLFAVSLIPIAFAVGLSFLQKYWAPFWKLNRHIRMAIIGVVFGVAAILCTIAGVPLSDGAVVNVRDTAPILAGLIFGGEAGCIAGLIGGLYRFVSVYWTGSGAFTQVACSVSTFAAGIFTALVRRFIFDKHHGNWYYGFFLGILIEDFHMIMVFLTHMSDVTAAYNVVRVCAVPMMLTNAFAVMIGIMLVSLIYKEKIFQPIHLKSKATVSTTIQIGLLLNIVFGYLIISSFSYEVIKNVVQKNTSDTLSSVLKDTVQEENDSIYEFCYSRSVLVKNAIDDTLSKGGNVEETLQECLTTYSLSEINIVSKENKIVMSNIASNIGFDMTSTKQSDEFTFLNDDVAVGNGYYVQSLCEPTESQEGKRKYAGAKLNDPAITYGYVQICYYQDAYYDEINGVISSSARNRHIGEGGFVAITNPVGKVISTVSGGKFQGQTIDLTKITLNSEATFTSAIGSETVTYYTYASYSEGYTVIALASQNEFDLPFNIGFIGITLTEIFVFLVLYAIVYMIIKRKVVNGITHVSNGLNDIGNGNLDVIIHQDSTAEFVSLSQGINKTVSTMKGFIQKEAEKNAAELAFAKNIQHSTLPTIFPKNDKFEIYALMETAKEVGGDFYDFYFIDHEHVVIQIADVSGKGIPAAMFMMRSKTILKSLIESGMDLAAAYTEANHRLCDGNEAQMFVTAWAGVIDLSTGHVEYVNAGHNPPLLKHKDGSYEYLKGKHGFVLAGYDEFKYKKQSFDIKPGDSIFLYTDGVTEANNEKKELYGEERLMNRLNGEKLSAALETCNYVISGVKEFVQDAEQSDDITMLCFKLNKNDTQDIMEITNKMENIPPVTDFVEKLLDEAGASEKAKMQIDVAIDEIISNIVKFAYPEGQTGKIKVMVEFSENKDEVKIIFEDHGANYNPLEKADPNTDLPLESRQIGGLGIFIVKKTMDNMEYENVNGYNVLTLSKKIK